jgi:DNA-directed RNA polymerase subunit M/transcription elongation factor TFIIS
MRFCTRNNCNNVLSTVTKHSDMVYRCKVCFEEYPIEDSDTLMIDEYLQESNTIHKHRNYLQNAHADSIIELTHKQCPNNGCKETIVHVVKIAQNGQSLMICPTCKHQFQ